MRELPSAVPRDKVSFKIRKVIVVLSCSWVRWFPPASLLAEDQLWFPVRSQRLEPTCMVPRWAHA